MQCADLIVEVLSSFIETSQTRRQRASQEISINHSKLSVACHAASHFKRIEASACVTVGRSDHNLARIISEFQFRKLALKRSVDEFRDLFGRQRFQDVHR